jgi:hypothetical protein
MEEPSRKETRKSKEAHVLPAVVNRFSLNHRESSLFIRDIVDDDDDNNPGGAAASAPDTLHEEPETDDDDHDHDHHRGDGEEEEEKEGGEKEEEEEERGRYFAEFEGLRTFAGPAASDPSAERSLRLGAMYDRAIYF